MPSKLLTELRVNKVSEKDVVTVREETKDFLVTAVTKLLEKCPLKYILVRNLAWAGLCGRGLSVNKIITVTNMKEQTLIAHRVIVDYLQHVSGVDNAGMTKKLLQSAGCARDTMHTLRRKRRQSTHNKHRN